jgi:hypothetical protein
VTTNRVHTIIPWRRDCEGWEDRVTGDELFKSKYATISRSLVKIGDVSIPVKQIEGVQICSLNAGEILRALAFWGLGNDRPID